MVGLSGYFSQFLIGSGWRRVQDGEKRTGDIEREVKGRGKKWRRKVRK